jgi:hypothetical protein
VKKLKRTALAVLLLPACYGVFQSFWLTLSSFKNVPEGSYWFFAGAFTYLALQWAFFTPIRTYVFGHELTHALAAWMSGGRVKAFHVSKKGGHVHVTKSNFFVALAPYMVPIYALMVLGLFFAIDHFYPLRSHWKVFLWLLGMAMGFHGALTIHALREGQPDLKPTGKLLSGVIIFLGNTASIIFLMGVLFPKTVSWHRFAALSGKETVSAWRHIGHGGYAVYHHAVNGLSYRN